MMERITVVKIGGNVNVTGLLTAQDIAPAIKAASEEEKNSTMVEQGADARCSDRASSADGIEGAASTGKGNHVALDTSEDCLSD